MVRHILIERTLQEDILHLENIAELAGVSLSTVRKFKSSRRNIGENLVEKAMLRLVSK